MTAARLKALGKITSDLEGLRDRLDTLQSEEREQYDNLSDKAQESERGKKIDTAATAIQDAYDSLDSAIDSISDAMQTE